MAVAIPAISTIIKLQELEPTHGEMAEPSPAVGSIIRWMGMVFSNGLMARHIKESIKMISNMVKGHLFGQMEKSTKACGGKECNMEKESAHSQTTHRLRVSGSMGKRLGYLTDVLSGMSTMTYQTFVNIFN